MCSVSFKSDQTAIMNSLQSTMKKYSIHIITIESFSQKANSSEAQLVQNIFMMNSSFARIYNFVCYQIHDSCLITIFV